MEVFNLKNDKVEEVNVKPFKLERDIQNLVEKLNIDLHTLVIDWEEMKDLQKSFFKNKFIIF